MRIRLAFILLALFGWLPLAILAACQANAEGTSKKGKIAAEKQQTWAPPSYTPPIDSPPAETIAMHSWYLGLVGGHTWAPEGWEDNHWSGGVVGGWLYRPSAVLGLGIEADYVVRDLGSAAGDGVASLRGRAGVFLGPTFVYATAGIHEALGDAMPDRLRRGLVVGGGIERDLAKHLALRLEALHYRHTDDYFAWGDDGSTTLRGGLVFKF